MPLRGYGGKNYRWCPICQGDVAKGNRLTTHLKGIHGLGLHAGCRECWEDDDVYISSKWHDVTKHVRAAHKHEDGNSNPLRTVWFLATEAPTYRQILREEVCPFPLKGEKHNNFDHVQEMALAGATPWTA